MMDEVREAIARSAWRSPKLCYLYALAEAFAETLPEDSRAEHCVRLAMTKLDEADMALEGAEA